MMWLSLKLLNAMIMVCTGLAAWACYLGQLQYTNAYIGYRLNPLDGWDIFVQVAMTLFLALLVPARLSKPSDFFQFFYAIFVVLSFTLFYPVTGLYTDTIIITGFALLVTPMVAMWLLSKAKVGVFIAGPISESWMRAPLLLMVIVVLVLALLLFDGGGFSVQSMYDRRLAGRDVIPSGSLLAYLFSMTFNGVGPYLGFLGAYRKNTLFILSGVLLGLAAFWLVGLKAPIAFTILFASLGRLARSRLFGFFPTLFLSALLGVCMLALVELLLFDQSLIAEFGIRRVFIVQAAIQSYFFDLMASSGSGFFGSVIHGLSAGGYPSLPYRVGALYLPMPDANANTSSFLLALASGGAVLYLAAIVFACLFFKLIDNAARRYDQKEYFFVGASYGLLLTEQAFTTAFVSSGIGLILLMLVLRKENVHNRHDVTAGELRGPTGNAI